MRRPEKGGVGMVGSPGPSVASPAGEDPWEKFAQGDVVFKRRSLLFKSDRARLRRETERARLHGLF